MKYFSDPLLCCKNRIFFINPNGGLGKRKALGEKKVQKRLIESCASVLKKTCVQSVSP